MEKGGRLPTAKLKNIPKFLWDEFVYGGHFLALGDAVAMYSIASIVGIKITWSFLAVVYLCVFSANLFNRSSESNHDTLTNPIRVGVMSKYSHNFYPIVIISLLVSGSLLVLYSGVAALFFAIFTFVISMLYTTIFKKMTKYIVGFKSFTAGFFYALMVFLMAIYYSKPIWPVVVIMFVFYFIRIFISNAACDVKDIESDKKRGLKTLAITFGESGSMKILNIVNVLSGSIIIGSVLFGVLPRFSLGLLLTVPFASYYFYLNSKTSSKELYTNLIVDGEFLFWPLFLLIGKLL